MLLLVDGNLTQQGHSLAIPVENEGVVGGNHRVVPFPDGLHAPRCYHNTGLPSDWPNTNLCAHGLWPKVLARAVESLVHEEDCCR